MADLQLRVFGDVSGKAEDSVIAAAFYVAPNREWLRLERDWRAALKQAGVEHFHATDFNAGYGEFAGWKVGSEAHVSLIRSLTALPAAHKTVGYAFAMETAPFFSVVRPILEKIEGTHRPITPRTFMVTACLTQMGADLLKGQAGQRAKVIFESEKGLGETVAYFKFCETRNEPWTRAFWSIHPGEKKEWCPLQAADLLAHEAWRRAKGWLDDPERGLRRSFAALLAGGVSVRFMTESDCASTAETLAAFINEYPQGLVGPRGSRWRADEASIAMSPDDLNLRGNDA